MLVKTKAVLWPVGNETNVDALREWDLWGPLIVCLLLTMQQFNFPMNKKKSIFTANSGFGNAHDIFATCYIMIFGGAAVIAWNAALVKSDG